MGPGHRPRRSAGAGPYRQALGAFRQHLHADLFPGRAKGDYWVLYVDDDYQTALVGNPNREYLWLLSRKPVVPDATRMKLLGLAHERGYQTDELIWRAADSSSKRRQ